MKRITILIALIATLNNVYAQHDHHDHEQQKPAATQKKPATKKKAATTKKAPAKAAAPQQKMATNTDTTRKAILPTQNEQHQHDASHQHAAPADTTKPAIQAQQGGQQPAHNHAAPQGGSHDAAAGHNHEGAPMSHAFSLNLPMTRNGSGTGWLPDESPMFGYMFHSKKWMYMLHGNLFLRYNKQDLLNKGSRGDSKFDAPNWTMLMGQRRVGKNGLFHFSAMVSLDPLITGGEGYPLLFQTGETNQGKPLVDRQHPHDLFSELSVSYAHALSPKADVFVYLGYPGEPAIGPVAFMHRPSALPNPDATLTHHWVDATHITFGVATLGVRYGAFKLEGSSFTGREPDEARYGFDKPRFDSYSGRLSFNPSSKWALQVSKAYIKEPELLHPGENVYRTTASATFSTYKGFGNYINATALWAVNKTKGHDGEHGILAEASYMMKRLSLYSRYEWVQKSAEELVLDEAEYGHHTVFPVHALTTGLNYDLFQVGQTKVAAGGHLTFYNTDKRISQLYGQNPLGAQLYLRIYPNLMGKRSGNFFMPY